MEPEPFRRHDRQGGSTAEEGHPPLQPDARRAQEQEERGVKEAVAGIGEDGKDAVIEGVQDRNTDGEAIPAVPAQPDEVERRRDGKRPAQAQPRQPPGHDHAQEDRREVPEVVEHALQQQVQRREPSPVEGQGQIEGRGGKIQQGGALEEPPRAPPLVPGEKIARGHEEEGHRHPEKDLHQEEVPRLRPGFEGGGVDGYHHHCGGSAKEVDGRPAAGGPHCRAVPSSMRRATSSGKGMPALAIMVG